MNDEAGSSSAAPPTAPPSGSENEASSASAHNIENEEAPSFYFSRKPRLQDLLAVLDRLIWLEVTTVYLLDNSFIRFALRCMIQAVYLMPKPKGFPEQNTPQPYVGGIIGSNILCITFHLINSPPAAGEATRGYLNGSLLLDFIGQRGPSSKLRLFLLDIVILLLQLVALAAITAKKELETKKGTETSSEANDQDHDSEERGEIRGTSTADVDSIELQELGQSSTGAAVMQESEEKTKQKNAFAVSDNIASGQAMVGEFYLVDNIRHVYHAYEERRRQLRDADAGAEGRGLTTMSGLRQRFAQELSNRRNPV